MKEFTQEMQQAIDYIEANLTEPLDSKSVAAQVFLSTYYFQRVFHAMCGISLSEYIRHRRLTRAGEILRRSEIRVIDAAILFGYDSPDSFSRAFQKFHGVLPSQAKECERLRSVPPIKISDMEERSMMEYRIVEKPAFTLVGVQRAFHGDTSYQEIPKFWQEWINQGENRPVLGMYGVCVDSDGDTFDYMIADDYVPWSDVPQGCMTRTIPASTWAVFPCRGALPEALQSVNTRIWKEWLLGNGQWRMAGNFNIELYTPPTEKPEDNYSEIWVPVTKE